MVIWLIGLAGAGKTTIGRETYAIMKDSNPATVFLDGDFFREVMGQDLGHSLADREKNGWRMCRMSAFLDHQGIDVVACVLSNFPEQQQWNRAHFSKYLEVYVEVPMAVLEQRDQKQLYSMARAGKVKDVVGIDLPFHPPQQPDLIIRNDRVLANVTPLAEQVVEAAWLKKSGTLL